MLADKNLEIDRLRLEYSRRPKPAPATNGSDCSSWPTAKARDASPEGIEAGLRRNSPNLTTIAQTWQTPKANDAEKRGPWRFGRIWNWSVRHRTGKHHRWQTPSVADTTGGHMTRGGKRSNELLLNGQAQNWPTPAARDYKGANGVDHLENGTGRLHMDQLPNYVAHGSHCLRLAPETSPPGPPPSKTRRSLNPLFVEWLMGWPMNWTLAEPGWLSRCQTRTSTPGQHSATGSIDCAAAETGFPLWLRRMRGELSRLTSLNITEPETQMALL